MKSRLLVVALVTCVLLTLPAAAQEIKVDTQAALTAASGAFDPTAISEAEPSNDSNHA